MPYVLTWSIASSTESTTRTARISARNSSPQSDSDAGATDGSIARTRASPRSSTPRERSASRAEGRNDAATEECTSSVSAALHTPGRWTLALTMIRVRHREVGGRVHVDVAVARRGVDHGHAGDGADRLLQALSPARDDQVDDALELGELGQLLAPAAGHERQRARRAGPRASAASRAIRASTSFECAARGRAAQQHRVAGLQAQRGGVDRDVRARLVDDGDHAQRDSNLAEVEPVGQAPAVDDLAHRVGQRGDRPRAVGDPAHPRLVERQAVHQARPRGRTNDRPRGRARWPRGSPAAAPPARRRSPSARRSWSPSRPPPGAVRRPSRRARGR